MNLDQENNEYENEEDQILRMGSGFDDCNYDGEELDALINNDK